MKLPADVEQIILNYRAQLIHSDKWRGVMFELQNMYWVLKRRTINLQFTSIYFPGFYTDLTIALPENRIV